MTQTPVMRADEIVNSFNGVTERKYWKASLAGTRTNPEVHFNSRATMVRVSYRIAEGDFTLTFSKSGAAFGDYMASAYRSLVQVLAALEAAGLPFVRADDFANLRLEYNARSKDVAAHVALPGDQWPAVDPLPFKVPERINSEMSLSGLDGL